MKDTTHRKNMDRLCVVGGLLTVVLALLRIFVYIPFGIIILPLGGPFFYLLGLVLYAWFKKT